MRTVFLLALAILTVGCGGGGGDTSFIDGNRGSVSIGFAGGADYNGLGGNTPLTAYTTLDGSAARRIVTINATNNNRSVEASLVASNVKEGTVVDLAETANASTVAYRDTVGRWASSSGTLEVTARTNAGVQLTLTNVVLTNVSGTGAAGTVTLNGTLSFVAR